MARDKDESKKLDAEYFRSAGLQKRWRTLQSFARDIYHSSLTDTEIAGLKMRIYPLLDGSVNGDLHSFVEDEPFIA